MPIRDCAVLAVEGPHASGKTTLVHALTSHYRERGIHVTATGEAARHSPFMEEFVLHDTGDFDLVCELDALGAHLTEQLRAARHHQLLICDKTLANVVAYARMLLPDTDTPAVEAMAGLCAATTHFYDAVVYTADTFNPRQPGDHFRDKVADKQHRLDELLREEIDRQRLPLIEMPTGMSTDQRVQWIVARLDVDRWLAR